MSDSRIRKQSLLSKVMTADQAAALIQPGMNVGMSGFTGAGYPKAVPVALAKRIMEASFRGEKFKIGVWTGASTAPELDGALAMVDGVELRLPYQSDPVTRRKINSGELEYLDIHLSHVAQFVRSGFLGKLDVALVEVTAIREDGNLVPSSSIGNNTTWLDCADKVILEVNGWQSEQLEGMHDVYPEIPLPPRRQPIPLTSPSDRIGVPFMVCPPEKIVGIVETHVPDRNTPFSAPDEDSKKIAGHILEFLQHEIKKGRMPESLLPLQSGVGNIANAVLVGLNEGPFENLTAYTEVIQDGMLDLMRSGKLRMASATAFSLSPVAVDELNKNMGAYRDRIILRPQEISNHPELIRRLGCISMNGMIECDLYGHVNSTHVMGSRIQNGIGGSGDFARNAYLSFFMTPSLAKGGDISCIVPMASHVDHTEHDTQIIVTEQGIADLRGLSPKLRAKQIIENCAHPSYRPLLRDYYRRALAGAPGKQSPHLLEEAHSFHLRYLKTDSMKG